MSESKFPKLRTSWHHWWPLLLGVAGMGVSIALYHTGPWRFYAKAPLEVVAIAVASLGVVCALARLAFTREPFHLLLLGVAVTVLLREIHWDWTKLFAYVSLATITVMAFVWHRRVFVEYLDRQPVVRAWFVSTVIVYVLSQAIARRVFSRVLPDEAAIYSDMEELMEVVAHAMLVVTVLVGPWRRAAHAAGDTPTG